MLFNQCLQRRKIVMKCASVALSVVKQWSKSESENLTSVRVSNSVSESMQFWFNSVSGFHRCYITKFKAKEKWWAPIYIKLWEVRLARITVFLYVTLSATDLLWEPAASVFRVKERRRQIHPKLCHFLTITLINKRRFVQHNTFNLRDL
jgi:hypothetical protein